MNTLLGRLRRPLGRDPTVTEERRRIARELHDVVAHCVSEMVVQASGVRCQLSPDQSRERAALLSLEEIGHDALNEMRRLLEATRQEDETSDELAPQPSLAQLDRLVAKVEQDGAPVTLRVEGERPKLPIGIDLSAYRIVEDALAHAHGAPTDVVVRYTDRAVEIEIAARGARLNGSIGMRERVALYGGTLEAGPSRGGYVLRAELPVELRR